MGDLGKKLHTGRSRNDQVATDLRLWTAKEIKRRVKEIRAVISALVDFAERSIALTIPRRTIADLSDDERWRIDEGRAWRRRDLMAGSGQLGDAMNWLVAKLVPPEMAATSPVLEVAVRVGTR